MFASPAEVAAAYAHGAVALQAEIGLRLAGTRVHTTAGRVLLFQALGERVPFERVNGTLNARDARALIEAAHDAEGLGAAVALATELRRFGACIASGSSLALGDFDSTASKPEILAAARERCAAMEQHYQEGIITDGERFSKTIDAWTEARDALDEALREHLDADHPLGALRDSGVIEDDRCVTLCAGMLGLVRGPGDDMAESPVVHSLAEGLTPHEAFLLAGSRSREAFEQREAHREARTLAEQLGAALGAVRIVADDCGAREGRTLRALFEDRRLATSLGTRITGRTVLEDVHAPDGAILVHMGDRIDQATARRLDRARAIHAVVRSPLTCRCAVGVCAACYGWAPAARRPVALGARVGLLAARTIAGAYADAIRRVRLIQLGSGGCWTTPSVERATIAGVARHHDIAGPLLYRDEPGPSARNPRVVTCAEGWISIRDDRGGEREAFRVRRGDEVLVADGAPVDRGQGVAFGRWSGEGVRVVELPEGSTAMVSFADLASEKLYTRSDELTGRDRSALCIGSREATLRLDVTLKDGARTSIAVAVPGHADLHVADGTAVRPGELLATERADHRVYGWAWPRSLLEVLRDRDESGWPREILAETSGTLHRRGGPEDGVIVRIEPDDGGLPQEVRAPHWVDPLLSDGARVKRGDTLIAGGLDPTARLRLRGALAAAEPLLDRIDTAFTRASFPVADVHLELVVRAMLSRVRVVDPGDTELPPGALVHASAARAASDAAALGGGRAAVVTPVVCGIDVLARG